ncbi:hypothetical protein BGV47_32055 [Burkholderia ubonensis]|nr:hypothetical protein WL24_00840 [Burkholderia ubonensis]OJA23530.1 hypothetical protein BGV47_32055 [Burkholderia ubonensis]OJB23504.1 hypothetical protein BGV55_24285 [Burkholderia ubonensis]
MASRSDLGCGQQDGLLQIKDPPRIDPAYLAPDQHVGSVHEVTETGGILNVVPRRVEDSDSDHCRLTVIVTGLM